MKINEIFYSIQGEGIYQGVPMVFIRFQGCDLIPHCTWCDTPYAQEMKEGGREMTTEEVIGEVVKLSPQFDSYVCITGGEPLWQIDSLGELVKWLFRGGYKVTVETNGSLPVPRWFSLVDSWSADIKCPSSGVAGVSKEEWFKTRPCDQIKFVVGNKGDLDFARDIIKRHQGDSPVVLVSPVINLLKIKEPVEDYKLNAGWLQEVVEFCKEEKVRFSLQLHKIIWGNKKGV